MQSLTRLVIVACIAALCLNSFALAASTEETQIVHGGKIVTIEIPSDLSPDALPSYVDRMIGLLDSRFGILEFFALGTTNYDMQGTATHFSTTVEHYVNYNQIMDFAQGETVLSGQVDYYIETYGMTRTEIFGPNTIYGPCKAVRANNFLVYADGIEVAEFGNGIPFDERTTGQTPATRVGGGSFSYDVSQLTTGVHELKTTWKFKTESSPECIALGSVDYDFELTLASGDFVVLDSVVQPPIIIPPPGNGGVIVKAFDDLRTVALWGGAFLLFASGWILFRKIV